MNQETKLIKLLPEYKKAIVECPSNEPLHYHHDGCPACIDITTKELS